MFILVHHHLLSVDTSSDSIGIPPDGRCPRNANNRNVKLSQGDLMLCPQCNEVRFPSGKDNVTPHVSSDKSWHIVPSYADRKRCAAAQCNGLGAMELQCTICDLKFHAACAGICNEVVSVLVPIAAEIGWVCATCRDAAKSSIRKLQAAHAKLGE